MVWPNVSAVGTGLLTIVVLAGYLVLRRRLDRIEWSIDRPWLLAISSVGLAITVVAASGLLGLYVAIPVLVSGFSAIVATSASDFGIRLAGAAGVILGASVVIGLILRLLV